MPRVMNETEILDQLARSLETDPPASQTPALPASRREHSGLITSLWGRVTSLLKPSARRQQHVTALRCHQPEMPLDTLAREHPYLHMRALIG